MGIFWTPCKRKTFPGYKALKGLSKKKWHHIRPICILIIFNHILFFFQLYYQYSFFLMVPPSCCYATAFFTYCRPGVSQIDCITLDSEISHKHWFLSQYFNWIIKSMFWFLFIQFQGNLKLDSQQKQERHIFKISKNEKNISNG